MNKIARISLTASVATIALGAVSFAVAQVISLAPSRITLGFGGTETDAGAGSPIQPVNGQYIAFRSNATNILEASTSGVSNIFLVNRISGVTSLVSATTLGAEGNNDSRAPSISPVSPNGFVAVAFESEADNFSTSPVDSNGVKDVFLHLPATGRTELVSIGAARIVADNSSGNPSVTVIPEPDRALVAFESFATNLIEGESADSSNIYLATVSNMASAAFNPATDIVISRVTRAVDPQFEPDGDSTFPQVSGNGRYVVYLSSASNLVSPSVFGGFDQVYIYDSLLDSTTLVSKGVLNEGVNDNCISPGISYNGRFVTYITSATNVLDDGAPTGTVSLIRYDTFTGASARVNVTALGERGNGSPLQAKPSADGRFISFTDDSDNLVVDDTNGFQDVFIKDMLTGEILRTNTSASLEQANNVSNDGTLSGDSFNKPTGVILFSSAADNLIEGDDGGVTDVFASSIQTPLETFTRQTGIEVPADLAVTNRKVTISMKDFAAIDLSEPATSSSHEISSVRTGRLRTNYDVRVEREGGSRLDKKKKIAKKNTTTVRKLKPGTYTVRYRVTVQRGQRTVRRSAFSPAQRVRIE